MDESAAVDARREVLESSCPQDSEPRKHDDVSQQPAEIRNWAQLPLLALSVIFRKIGAVDVMTSAQWVCRPWHELSMDPLTWRVVDMTMHEVNGDGVDNLVKISWEVVARSNGLMEEFYAKGFGDDPLFDYIAEITNGGLKSLRLISIEYGLSDEAMIRLAERSPKLEYLEISLCLFPSECFESIIRACPKLKHFSCNHVTSQMFYYWPSMYPSFRYRQHNEEAFRIANNLKELRHLQLVGFQMTNDALNAILDSCTHLQTLDIRESRNLTMDENLTKKCARIKTLRLPDDSLSDFDYAFAFVAPEPDEDFLKFCLNLFALS